MGSSPDEVDSLNCPNSSGRTMALGSTQPLTEMSTRNLPGCKGRPFSSNIGIILYHIVACLIFTEPEMKPKKKVEEHSQNKVKKKTETDKKVMRK
jgi:hypothetical protein